MAKSYAKQNKRRRKVARGAVKARGVQFAKMPQIQNEDLPTAVVDDDSIFGTRHKGLYKRTAAHRMKEWRDTVVAYEAHPEDFFNAWHYLNDHPIFYHFGGPSTSIQENEQCLIHGDGIERTYFMVVRADPKTRRIENNPARNTRTYVWFETGPWLWESEWVAQGADPDHIGPWGIGQHDISLDGGAPSFEKAVIKLARWVHNLYGNDRRKVHV